MNKLIFNKLIFVFVILYLLSLSIELSYPEIPVMTRIKGFSKIYSTNSEFFSELLMNISGGGKYEAEFNVSSQGDGSLSNVLFSLDLLSFELKVFDFMTIGYWYGNKKYIGYYSDYQSQLYQDKKNDIIKGWHIIDGTGINIKSYFFDGLLNLGLYAYRSKNQYDGLASIDLTGEIQYMNMVLEGLVGIFSNNLRAGIVYRTLFKTINAILVVAIPNINLLSQQLSINSLYFLGEEKISVNSPDGSWGVEQILTIYTKPDFFDGILLTDTTNDISARFSILLKLLYKLLLGGEGIVKAFGGNGPITQISASVWVSPIIGLDNGHTIIKLQPYFEILNTQNTNNVPGYRIFIRGEVKF